MSLYISVVACACFLAWMVWRYDMYEKEPWYMLLLAAGLGFSAAFAVGFLEDGAIAFLDAHEHVRSQAVIAAVFEETAKLLIVVSIAVCVRSQFNDPIDGLIYGAFAGLGFAVYESWFYLSLSRPDPRQSGAEVVRLVLHLLMGGLGGFGFGLARFPGRMRLWPLVLASGVAAALLLHFFWDYWCGIPRDDVTPGFRRAASVGLLLTATTLFGVFVWMGVQSSRAMFAPDDEQRLWGWPFSQWFGRQK